jgi:hypothetical protein
MTDVLKIDNGQPAAQTLPEVEFALIISRTINALNDDPALLRSSVYELARITLGKDPFDGDPERGQRLAQALETAIRGVEDFSARQMGAVGRGGSITGPMSELSETARLIAPQLPAAEIYPPSQHRAAALPIIQMDHPAFESDSARTVFARDIPIKRSRPVWHTALFALGAAALVLSAIAVIRDRAWIRSFLASTTATQQPPAVSAQAGAETATAPAPAPAAARPAPPPVPDLPLPTTYGNYVLKGGELAELELLEGQVPDKRVAISSPIHTPSRTILPDGSPTFVIFRRDLAAIPTDNIEARVVAKINHTMKVDSQTRQATYTPEELWSIRPFAYKFRSAPIPGNPEMMLIKPDGVVLPPGRYVLALKRQGYDFTVAGKITDLNQCLERTEAANGTFYSACSKIP